MALVLGQQLGLTDVSGRTHKVNVQSIKAMDPVDELIECLPEENVFGCATKYRAKHKLIEDFNWSSNPKVLPYVKDQPHVLFSKDQIAKI